MSKTLPFQFKVEYGEKALLIAREMKYDSLANFVHTQLGVLYWHDGQFKKAMGHLNEGQNHSIILRDSVNQAKCTHYKGLVYYYQCKFDSALQLYNQAERIYKSQNKDSAIAKIKSHKGLIYSAMGHYKLAIQNMLEAFQIQESRPDYRDFSIRMDLASDAAEQLYYEGKLNKDLESLRFIEKKGDPDKLAFTLQNIGSDYSNLKRYEEAVHYFKRGSKVYKTLNQPSLLGGVADSYRGIGNYDSALYYYRQWEREILAAGTQIHLVANYTSIAKCYELQEKWEDALRYYELSSQLNHKIGLRRSEANNLKAKANIFAELKKWPKALGEINSAEFIAKEIGCIGDVRAILELKARILRNLHRSDEAIDAILSSKLLQDSIKAGEAELQTAQLQIEYETEKKSRDLAALQSQNITNEEKIQLRNLQIALAFSMLIIIAVAGGFYYYHYTLSKNSGELLAKKNQMIETQNRELQVQNREKEILLGEIHHRVKNNLQIISSLINLKSKQVTEETKATLQQLNGTIFSLGLVHEKLYQAEKIQLVRLDLYLADLGHHLIQSFTDNENNVTLQLNCDAIELDADRTMSCGLICNELLTNSLKHAFGRDQSNKVIGLTLKQNNGLNELTIFDNGEGSIAISIVSLKSFGLRFVDQLVTSKLKGNWNLKTENGCLARITFSQ